MSIFLSLVPWFVFWIFLSLQRLEVAAFGGFAFAFFIILLGIWKKYSIKILELGTLIFFFITALLYFFVNLDWLVRWINSLGSVALFLIVLISILIKKPFTLQYARETTPKERWFSPAFMHVNYIISWAWCLMMFINSIFSVLFTTILPVQSWVNWVVSLSCFGIAILFTNQYRRNIKKKQ